MKNLIGTFAKADWRNKSVYGMVVSTQNVCGVEKVVFAFADPTQWVAFLTDPKEITEVTKPKEVAEAIKSANHYWIHELKSLEQRAAMHYAEDDEEQLERLIKVAREWIDKLGL